MEERGSPEKESERHRVRRLDRGGEKHTARKRKSEKKRKKKVKRKN